MSRAGEPSSCTPPSTASVAFGAALKVAPRRGSRSGISVGASIAPKSTRTLRDSSGFAPACGSAAAPATSTRFPSIENACALANANGNATSARQAPPSCTCSRSRTSGRTRRTAAPAPVASTPPTSTGPNDVCAMAAAPVVRVRRVRPPRDELRDVAPSASTSTPGPSARPPATTSPTPCTYAAAAPARGNASVAAVSVPSVAMASTADVGAPARVAPTT